ncbi:MAG: Clp protease N-terminal domain-containing protein [Phototrophicaceae bacterium]
MSNSLRTLTDILIDARKISSHLNHRYLGVEHLTLALIRPANSVAHGLIQRQGVSPQLIADLIEQKIGIGNASILWSGLPYTPRTNVILNIAHDLALESERHYNEVHELDLMLAILMESDSLIVRILNRAGLDTESLMRDATV